MTTETNDHPPQPPPLSESSIPANANTECVGPTSSAAGTAHACDGCPNQTACASGAFSSPEAQAQAAAQVVALQASLSKVAHVVLVLSGKGGVGKSTVAAQLAHTLADASSGSYAVGLLDVDLCGPSAPRMMLGEASLHQTVQKSSSGHWIPVYTSNNTNSNNSNNNHHHHNPIAVMSISFLLENANQAVVWRGPRKNALIQQFLTQVDWTGDTDGLDYLIIDTPPGTSDEHISTVQYLQKAHTALAGAIVVTTPEEVSLADVRKELNFCQKTNVPVLGVVENMGTYQASFKDVQFVNKKDGSDGTATVLQTLQEKCPEVLEQYCISSQLFSDHHAGGGGLGGAEQMAADYNVPFWGRLPLDPQLLQACEKGQAYVTVQPEAPAALALQELARKLTTALPVAMAEEDETMA